MRGIKKGKGLFNLELVLLIGLIRAPKIYDTGADRVLDFCFFLIYQSGLFFFFLPELIQGAQRADFGPYKIHRSGMQLAFMLL